MKREGGHGPRVVAAAIRLRVLVLVAIVCCSGTVMASVASAKVVHYRGYRLAVPTAWPVYNLTSDPTVCVRFDRHAVYLGRPSSKQRCPAHAVGRTEAVLLQPLSASDARAGGAGRAPGPVVSGGAQLQLAIAARGVIVTATWGKHPGIVERALGIRSSGSITAGAASARRPAARARSAVASGQAGAVYTGLGFDACSSPSAAQMSAWGSSPYRAVGIYIGGTNMACAQPNLTAAWVSEESAAGWHLIPTYVGLQAPTNSCGCAGIVPGRASAEGTAAASDAIAQAQPLGIGAGNPIYIDMEAYPRGGSNTSAVLTFLSSWTAQLHRSGYRSGIYSSGGSGISDLVADVGTTTFNEPDDIWIADWNDEQTTTDPYVPSGDWTAHQRLHQYVGSHNETYDRTTLNIDGNYLDGATAAAAGGVAVAPAPALTVAPGGDGSIRLHASWNGASGVASWRVLSGEAAAALTPLGGAPTPGAQLAIAVHSTFPYFAVQALGAAGQVLGTSQAVATPAHIAIYGHTMFSPSRGLGGVPAGCFTGSPCHITTTISAGRTVIGSTGPKLIPAGGGGIVYFRLSPAGRAMLARARGHRLTVQVSARDAASGTKATTTLTLVLFVTSGATPRVVLHASPALRIVGLTEFVYGGAVGGILAGCFASAPCHVSTTITAGRTTISSTGTEALGANELGYLLFKLTPQGHAMLARARGNHLGAQVTITDGSATATANVALVGFH
jgi:Domain of unknown function (DUF1906)